jgi:hypothetical protein
MRNWIVLIAVCLTATCAPVGAPSASPSTTLARTSATPSATVATADAFTMTTDREMITFAADRGALIAFSTKDAPPPYESKVQRADPATNLWRTIYTSDAHFSAGRVASARAALAEIPGGL